MAPNLRSSVIIPTYNRPNSLGRALASLSAQEVASDSYEVIVVDDGSSDQVDKDLSKEFPLSLRLLSQSREGATKARNLGAKASRADVLIFMDDDVTVSKNALQVLADACTNHASVLATGQLIARVGQRNSSPCSETLVALSNGSASRARRLQNGASLHFTQCNTQLLAVQREDFHALGMFQDPTGGWPNWDDVDFGYRAHLRGFRILQCSEVVGEHWDYSLSDLSTSCLRWRRASKSAVRLFERHPGLKKHIPMFEDKGPIDWGADQPPLIARKLARSVLSSPPAYQLMSRSAHILERVNPSSMLVRKLYTWLLGACMFQGYREGLCELTRGSSG